MAAGSPPNGSPSSGLRERNIHFCGERLQFVYIDRTSISMGQSLSVQNVCSILQLLTATRNHPTQVVLNQ